MQTASTSMLQGSIFKPAEGDLLGLETNEDHINVEWCGPGRVLFSMTRHGNGISAHFAADKSGLRYIKRAINDFCNWVFEVFEWCTMVLAFVGFPSVERLIQKCGFVLFAKSDNMNFYMRCRP